MTPNQQFAVYLILIMMIAGFATYSFWSWLQVNFLNRIISIYQKPINWSLTAWGGGVAPQTNLTATKCLNNSCCNCSGSIGYSDDGQAWCVVGNDT